MGGGLLESAIDPEQGRGDWGRLHQKTRTR